MTESKRTQPFSISIKWHFVASRVIMIFVSSMVTLLILEGMVRIFMPQQLTPTYSRRVWMPDEIYGWRQKPHLDIIIDSGEREIRLITDEHGYRIGPEKRGQSAYQVLALGDSFVAALQVNYEQTMTALLEDELSQTLGKPVVVVNGGVSGWGPNHYLLREKEELARAAYDLVLLFIFVRNDIVSSRVASFPPIQRGESSKLRWPRTLDSTEIRDAITYPINDYLDSHSHLHALYEDKMEILQMRMGLISPYFYENMLRSEAESPKWQVTGEIYADIAAEADGYNVPVLFILLPVSQQVAVAETEDYFRVVGIDPDTVDLDQPSRLLTAEFQKHNLLSVDLLVPFREAYAAYQTQLYGKIDPHFSPDGHRVAADFLQPVVADLLTQK